MSCKKNIIQLVVAVFLMTLMTQKAFAEDKPPVDQSNSRLVTDEEGISADIFGWKGGRFHPFLLLEEIYTDNLFATGTDKKETFVTTIAPGIWFASPANREKLLSIDTATTSPGGLNLSRIKSEATRRYQSYFLYSPEFVIYSDLSKHNHVNHRAEGLLQYNLDSGLSFDLMDLFNDKEEIAGNGIANTLYQFQENLLDFITTYDTHSEKLKLQFTYSNFNLDYEDAVVTYRNRNDNTFGFSVFYEFWPRISLFGEYDRSIINYDTGTINDSIENRYFAGVNWNITAKSKGTFKLGYMDKNFELAAVEDQSDFSIELQALHQLTQKRAVRVNGYRKFNESDLANASSFLSTGIDIGLTQRFTEKWSGTLNASYEQKDYNGFDRDDDLYGLGTAVRFKPRKWLIFDLGYQYYNNDSNINSLDYRVNEIFLRANLSM